MNLSKVKSESNIDPHRIAPTPEPAPRVPGRILPALPVWPREPSALCPRPSGGKESKAAQTCETRPSSKSDFPANRTRKFARSVQTLWVYPASSQFCRKGFQRRIPQTPVRQDRTSPSRHRRKRSKYPVPVRAESARANHRGCLAQYREAGAHHPLPLPAHKSYRCCCCVSDPLSESPQPPPTRLPSQSPQRAAGGTP